MRFLLRGLTGLVLLAATVALAALAGLRLADRLEGDGPSQARRAEERSFVVSTATLEPVTARPVIETHGVIESRRSLDIRAPVPGRVTEIAERFRDGAKVAEGALLLRIDPADYEARVADAEAALAEARADADEARAGVESAKIELRSAETQRALRAATFERRQGLAERGVASDASVEESELAVAAAEQTVASRRQAVVTARLRVDRADLAIHRAELALAEARRDLADTAIRAPFAGVLSETAATLGDIAAANQSLGRLIDPAALEVAFRVTNAQYAHLLDPAGNLRPLSLTLSLPLGDAALEAEATLDRPGAVSGAGRTGRLLYARVTPRPDLWLRPDDFVTIRLPEPPLTEVAIIPAAAATEDGRILLLTDDGRLEETRVTILRRERDRLIVGDAPFGATYVTERGPQLAPGLKARPRGAAPDQPNGAARRSAAAPSARG